MVDDLPLSAFIAQSLEHELKKSKRRRSKYYLSAMAPPVPDMMVGYLKQFVHAEVDKDNLNQSAILQHWLGISSKARPSHSSQNTAALNALQDAIIVALDVEWFEHDSSLITELGVSILDPRDLPSSGTQSPWSILSKLQTHHICIKRNTHLVNGDLCPGYPDQFKFGITTYASIQSAKEMLQSVFLRHDPHGYARPILFLGHAVDNDYNMIKSRFGLDLEALGTIVATLDTQVLACEQGLAEPSRMMRLQHLLEHYDIDEPYLHNAGNDVVATVVAALLMSFPGSTTRSSAAAYAELKTILSATNSVDSPAHTLFGKSRFCTRCDSDKHTKAECKRELHCEHCAKDPEREHLATQHKSDKCRDEAKRVALEQKQKEREALMEKRYAVPCQWCIESMDTVRNDGAEPYGHRTEECPWP
ncbi:hypothetical protein yc1106_06917 [Curvularia clavata]|uniref:Gfd2/YDR514C-like C-terminal domain-containing protein n=1 Tax=Curvularia clavata TaxID=95742 RepID=A0A9Q9DTB3_CURCL|nr:hypothetical protein yc1106_06917 [Curvularia clavata]